jgi:peptide/nickel transport system substrate-binding protein
MANPKVELAVRYALDYGGFRKLWPGSITPGTDLMVGLPGAYGPKKAFKRDLKRARQLLSQAGYAHGFRTTLDYPDITYGGVAFTTNAEKIKADLADVGIEVTLRPGDFSVSLAAYREGKQGFGYWLWGPNILDPSDLLSFLPGGTAATRANWRDSNADPVILKLRQQASAQTNQKARLKLYAKIQTYLQRKGPFAPFNEPPVQTAYRSTIAGYVWHPAWQFDVSLLRRVK